ncbi:MAG: carboxymuconolactone decarboxylase family protein [Thiomonas sp.]
MPTAKLDLPPQTLESSSGKARELLATTQSRLGFVPAMYANMANSPGLLQTYMDGYARFRAESGFTPAEQEVVFLTISRYHRCQYCMAAHSLIAERMSQVASEVLAALREGRPVPDPRLQALSRFTEVMVDTRGNPTPADLQAFREAGYTDRQALEIVLALAVKTLSNFSNHLMHTAPDGPFAAYAWGS